MRLLFIVGGFGLSEELIFVLFLLTCAIYPEKLRMMLGMLGMAV